MSRCSGRCAKHVKTLGSYNRHRYHGHLPYTVSLFIRSCLLRSIQKEDIVNELKNMKEVENEEVAVQYIDEFQKLHPIVLLDNGFWWQDTTTRKNGERYKRIPKTKEEKNKKVKRTPLATTPVLWYRTEDFIRESQPFLGSRRTSTCGCAFHIKSLRSGCLYWFASRTTFCCSRSYGFRRFTGD